MKKFTATIISVMMVTVVFASFTAIVQNGKAETLYVGGEGAGNFTSIQEAIDNAKEGDTIFVFNGTYFETIKLGKAIAIVGEKRDNTIIDGGGVNDTIEATANIDIREFTLANAYISISLFNTSNSIITNCTFTNNSVDVSLSNSVCNIINSTFDDAKCFFDNNSEMFVQNFLHVYVEDSEGEPISGAIVSVKDNDNEIYNLITGPDGYVRFLLIVDRVINATGITENITIVSVSYDGLSFENNDRDVDMSTSHTETFKAQELYPRVLSTSPYDGEKGVALDEKITITFSKEMDNVSVENAFSLIEEGMIKINGTFEWSNSNKTMTFTPSLLLKTLTNYTARITTDAMDVEGNHLQNEYVFNFTTAGGDIERPYILKTYPVDGAVNIPVNTSIALNFSEAMNKTSVENAFNLSLGKNRIEGKFQWESDMNVTFIPDSDLQYNSEYTVVISTTAKDIAGNALQENFTFSFTTAQMPDTESPTIISTYPVNGAKHIPLNISITVNFSEPMNETSVENAFNLSLGKNRVDGAFQWNKSSEQLIFTPLTRLEENAIYNVTISTTAKDIAGNALQENFTFSFTTQDLTSPRIISTYPEDNEKGVPVDVIIEIEFSEAMNQTSVENAFLMVDESENKIDGKFKWSGNNMTFDPDRDLESGTGYTVSIGTEAKDLAGNSLELSKEFSFNTLNHPPEIEPIPDATVKVGEEFSYQIVASDEDGDELSYEAMNAPDGFNISDGIITFTPSKGQDGEYAITIIVKDGKGGENSTTFNLTVEKEEEMLFGLSLPMIGAIVATIIAVVLIIVFLVRRKKRIAKEAKISEEAEKVDEEIEARKIGTLTKEQKLELLEERLLYGDITLDVYKELRRKYEGEGLKELREEVITPEEEVRRLKELGDNAYNIKNYELALRYYDRALAIDPGKDNIWNNKGNALVMLGRLEEALECYKRVLEINPSNIGARKNLDYVKFQLESQARAPEPAPETVKKEGEVKEEKEETLPRPEEFNCPRCGTKVKTTWESCFNCGYKLP